MAKKARIRKTGVLKEAAPKKSAMKTRGRKELTASRRATSW
jgi:hypothetical protein